MVPESIHYGIIACYSREIASHSSCRDAHTGRCESTQQKVGETYSLYFSKIGLYLYTMIMINHCPRSFSPYECGGPND